MKNDRIEACLKKANSLPLTPGVYIMKNREGEIIYIGKAKKLRNRVSQYFARFESHTGKTRRMVENVCDFDYILTTSELEALTLECSQIKQHRPKYNILLKDDKGFCFIRQSREQYPRFTVVYHKKDDGAEYFGPFMSAGSARQTLELASKLFLLPTCTRKLEYGKRSERPCLNYFIKQCCAPCTGRVPPERYAENVKDALAFINGGMKQAVEDMTARMKAYSDAMEYEKAAQLRDRIAAVDRIWQRQGVVSDDCREHDAFAITSDGVTQCVCVLNVREGRVKLKESSFFDCDETESGPELLTSFICEYYSEDREVPPVVALASEPEDFALLREWLSAKRGRRVSLRCKGRGDLPKTARICLDNAEEALVQYSVRRGGKKTKAAEELKAYLGLTGELTRIEAYDISHTGGKTTVGGMVVFENGAPKKSDYRRFRVSVTGGDDYAATAEVISRRLAHLGEKGFERPDVILLDGGAQHVAVVGELFREKGVDIPFFGMVKDNKHSLRGLVSPDGELDIGKTTRAFRLLYAVSEEVHRFAISYHRAARSAELKTSQLRVIDGVGESRAAALLKAFGSVDGVRAATVDELAAVKGMSRAAAENVRKFFDAIPADA